MIRITHITIVNGTRRRIRATDKTFINKEQLELYRERLKDVLTRRANHNLEIDFTYKELDKRK